ncbi:MAG: elongation factor P 5-aminopentanone reductase [Sarcina sp.]
MSELRGKVAIVTGGSKGIGKAIALELAKNGASVVINYSNDDDAANDTINEIKDIGAFAIAIKASIGTIKGCETLINETIAKFGKLDILVNNAAISKVGLFMDNSYEEIDELLNINLKGTMICSKLAITELLNNKGTIINISSIWGNVGASCEVLYSTSKGAINLFTKSLAKELAAMGVRVNAVAPGVINTEMNSWMSSEEKESLEEEIPMNRFGETSEIAKAVLFLASENSSYITGQVLTIDGGML